MKKNKEGYDLMRFTYMDSSIDTGQSDEPINPCKIEIVGFVIKETKEYVTLANEIVDGEEFRGQVSIPKVAMIKNKRNYRL
jgi:hypothetical protein